MLIKLQHKKVFGEGVNITMNKEQFFVPTIDVLEFSENNAILTNSVPTVNGPGEIVDLPDDRDGLS